MIFCSSGRLGYFFQNHIDTFFQNFPAGSRLHIPLCRYVQLYTLYIDVNFEVIHATIFQLQQRHMQMSTHI